MKLLNCAIMLLLSCCAAFAQEGYAVVNISACNVRLEPKFTAGMDSQAILGTPVHVLGINEDNNWPHIQTPDGSGGWVHYAAVTLMNKEDYEGAKYTSARMITKGKFSFTYGTVEARIALPVGKGIWPAFWMLGENIDAVSWPACGEIDIIETVNSENIVYGTNHWANGSEYTTYGNNTGNYRDQKFDLDVTQFHNYKFTWDEKYIRMFVDDFMYHEILIENNEGDTEEFHKPFFFILNVAVAGNWPGFEVDDSQFPNEMLVDYIRVTQ